MKKSRGLELAFFAGAGAGVTKNSAGSLNKCAPFIWVNEIHLKPSRKKKRKNTNTIRGLETMKDSKRFTVNLFYFILYFYKNKSFQSND